MNSYYGPVLRQHIMIGVFSEAKIIMSLEVKRARRGWGHIAA